MQYVLAAIRSHTLPLQTWFPCGNVDWCFCLFGSCII